MSNPDIRSTKLEWIRDGSNWLVGLSTGALVLSGTYFFDRFDRAPNAATLLVIAWISLGLSALFGVLTSFSAWKDLKPTVEPNVGLGGWVNTCYTVMMFTFVAGYICLATALILGVLAAARGAEAGPEIFLAGRPLPPFAPASVEAPREELVQGVCRARDALHEAGVRAALVIGRHDRRELSLESARRFGASAALAQQRAERVAALLTDTAVCKSRGPAGVLTLVAGPRHLDSPSGMERASFEARLAEDRRVEVYGLRRPSPARSMTASGSAPR